MKIIVDAFGGDNAPLEILKACAEAVTDFDIDILLTGEIRMRFVVLPKKIIFH